MEDVKKKVGRPPKIPTGETKKVTVHLPYYFWVEVSNYKMEKRMTFNSVVIRALRKLLNETPPPPPKSQ